MMDKSNNQSARSTRVLFPWASMWRVMAALLVVGCALLANTEAALAQQSGGAGEILSAIDQVVSFLGRAMAGVGMLGLMAAAIAWVFSGTNEKRREKATGWMVGTGFVILVGFAAPAIVGFLQSIAPGGGV